MKSTASKHFSKSNSYILWYLINIKFMIPFYYSFAIAIASCYCYIVDEQLSVWVWKKKELFLTLQIICQTSSVHFICKRNEMKRERHNVRVCLMGFFDLLQVVLGIQRMIDVQNDFCIFLSFFFFLEMLSKNNYADKRILINLL